VNDRLDLAVLLGADGVHLGEASVTAADARRVVGPAAFISRACHEPHGVLEPGVDAWVLSPIFGVRKGRAALGAAALTRLRDRCRAAGQGATAPLVLALGGVTAPVAKAALRAGADGVAVIGAVLSSDRVESLLSELEIAR
jgi:thiamine-phosphate pyrophosphorylase